MSIVSNELAKSGTVEASDVVIQTTGFRNVHVHFNNGTATTGTITLRNTPPGMTSQHEYTDNTYTASAPFTRLNLWP